MTASEDEEKMLKKDIFHWMQDGSVQGFCQICTNSVHHSSCAFLGEGGCKREEQDLM
jgi:hypothetical protein